MPKPRIAAWTAVSIRSKSCDLAVISTELSEAQIENADLQGIIDDLKGTVSDLRDELGEAFNEVEMLVDSLDDSEDEEVPPEIPESVLVAVKDLRQAQEEDENLNSSATALLKGKVEILEELFGV